MVKEINNHGKSPINLCKASDLRILNGCTKGYYFGRATFHGNNGVSVVDYIICDQEGSFHLKWTRDLNLTFQKILKKIYVVVLT